MSKLKTYPFTPINNPKQDIHIISIQDRIKKGQTSVLNAHRTDFYIVQIITKGYSQHMVDFNIIDVKMGDVLIIKPNQIHQFFTSDSYEGWLIAFTEQFYAQTAQNINFLENASIFNHLSCVSKINYSQTELDLLLELVEQIKVELNGALDVFQKIILNNCLSNILMKSERKFRIFQSENFHTDNISPINQLVTNFKKLVGQHFNTHTKVSYYAGLLNSSERKLQKATMTLLGKSPKEIIMNQIILESKRLLVHEMLSIKEISYKLGFEEPTNFTKYFKKYTGISPVQFRNMR